MGTTKPLDDREMAAWHALLSSHAVVLRKLDAELEAGEGLSLPEYEVLAHLSQAPDHRLRMSELALTALLSASGVTRLVDRLAREGLVRRERGHGDQRIVHAVLTDEGMARLRRAYPTHLHGVREHVLDRLDPAELDAVTAALGKLIDPGTPPLPR